MSLLRMRRTLTWTIAWPELVDPEGFCCEVEGFELPTDRVVMVAVVIVASLSGNL